ncbi:MAG: type III pantothenate kinase [Oscillospiraceae bacterium]|nr:type III pantothenate kinase [Oscillospiraceae bacterium]
MILTLEIGNTNIIVGLSDGEKMLFTEPLLTHIRSTALEYAIAFKSILELYKISADRIEGAIIASVVPSETPVVKQALEKIITGKVMVVGPGVKTGLSITIDNPAQLGADLVAGAVAGIKQYGAPLIIFDMGTATTVSVIDENRKYIGGMILTGVATALEALISKTSLLQRVALESPKKLIGSNTADCMKSGAVFGTAASIDGIIDRLEEEIGQKTTVVATGISAEIVVPCCRHDIIIDNELIIKGLVGIYKRNI